MNVIRSIVIASVAVASGLALVLPAISASDNTPAVVVEYDAPPGASSSSATTVNAYVTPIQSYTDGP